jgi:hypothetical protein
MNKLLKVLIVVIFIPVSVIMPVLITQTIALDSRVYAQQSTLQKRLEKYKAKLQETQDKNEINRLKLRCDIAQKRLKVRATNVAKIQETRTEVYDKITTKFDELITVLKENDIDTTELENEVKELKAKIDTHKSDMTAYKQAIDDASELDCTEDPEALKAALEEARSKLGKLISQIGDVRAYIRTTIKPTLKEIRAEIVEKIKLEAKESEESQDQSQNSRGDEDATQ